MAKSSVIKRNLKRKLCSSKSRTKRSSLSVIAKDIDASFEDRLKAQIKLSKMPRDGSYVRYRNRCSLTGRPRGNLRKFGLSRIALRELANWGQIPGLIKSSW